MTQTLYIPFADSSIEVGADVPPISVTTHPGCNTILCTPCFKTSFDNLSTDIVNDTTPQLGGALDGQNNNLSNIGTIDGANLQLDFGTL